MAKKEIKLGETHFIGAKCLNGVIAPRRISDRHCTCEACTKSKTARSRGRKSAAYLEARTAMLARSSAWAAANPDRRGATRKAWKEANRDKRRAEHHLRRARKLNATPPWFGEVDELVMLEAADLAQRREDITGYPWHVDHMVPLKARAACGLHCASNVQVIPAAMNISKHNKMKLTEPGSWLKAA